MHLKKNISSVEPTDLDLANQYRLSNDLDILGVLFQRYADLVLGVCLKYLKNPEDAQDHSMAIFEELIVKLKKHEVINFKGWLHTVTRNHCLMHLRSDKKLILQQLDEEYVQSEQFEHLDNVTAREENFRLLDNCLGQLGNQQRRIIELFYLEDKCYNEIAFITGIEWGKIRSYIQNGRRNLKLCIEKQKEKSAF